jgi:hypothetical protein
MSATERLTELRKPFPAGKVGKLPRVTCKTCSDRNARCTEHQRRKCTTCGGYLSTAHIHIDYVGHAEVTRRLLDVDPLWSWEPLAFAPNGLPALDGDGGMWIKLTVAGVTRLGYGDASNKRGGDAMKETIGDAIRNAAMRFGVALDLWSKEKDDYIETEGRAPEPKPVKSFGEYLAMIAAASDRAQLTKVGQEMAGAEIPDDDRAALRTEFTNRMNELKESK